MFRGNRKTFVFIIAVLAAMALVAGPLAGQALAKDYVIWGRGHTTTNPPRDDSVKIGVGSKICGNVGSQGDVFFNGAVEVSGTVDTNSQFSHGNGVKVGMPPVLPVPPNSNNYGPGVVNENLIPPVVPAGLPSPAALLPGSTFVAPQGNGGVFNFVPGVAYQDVSGGGGCDLIFPAAGDYYFDSLNLANGATLKMDLSGGPIRIFVLNEAHFGGDADVEVTGGAYTPATPNIYFEAQWAGVSGDPNAFSAGGGSDWLGDVFCPYGGIHFGSGAGPTTFDGHFWSDWTGFIGNGQWVLAVDIEHGVRNPCGGTPPPPPGIFIEKLISIDGLPADDPAKVYEVWDTQPGPLVPLGTDIYFLYHVVNGQAPATNVHITDSVFNAMSVPPFLPDPPGNMLAAGEVYDYVYGPVKFETLFPCVNSFLVWGKGTTTNAALRRDAVVVGVGSQIWGNVGSEGDVYLNGGAVTKIHGDMVTASQFGQNLLTQITGVGLINQSPWPDPPYAKPVFPASGVFPGAVGAAVNLASGASWTPLHNQWYGAVNGGSNVKVYLTAGNYYFDSLTFTNGLKIYEDVSGGQINVYVKKQAKFGSAQVFLTPVDPLSVTKVWWESQWSGTTAQPYGFTLAGGTWLGNVFCKTSGIHFGNGSESGTWTGYMWSGWDGKFGTAISNAIYIEHSADVFPPPVYCEHHDQAQVVAIAAEVPINGVSNPIWAHYQNF